MSGLTPPASPYEAGRTHCVDCVEGMRALGDATVDLLLADPPFNLDNKGRMFRSGRLALCQDMAWDQIDNGPWLAEALRVIKPTGTLIVFGSWHNVFDLGSRLQQANVRILNTIALVKTGGFAVSHRVLYERTLYAIWASPSGRDWCFDYGLLKRLSGRQACNVWPYTPPSARSHPTQKGVDVLERMVLMASRPGALVLDPFMGSGTTAEACLRQGRKFLGFEKSPVYAAAANARIHCLRWAADFAVQTRRAVSCPSAA